jgi:malate dehydrogenase
MLQERESSADANARGGNTLSDDWHSAAVCYDASCDVEKGLISSFSVLVHDGKWKSKIMQCLPIDDFSRAKIDASVAQLQEERSLVSELIS